jgi:hypothetical protein
MITLPVEMALSVALASGSISSRAAGPTANYISRESWKTRNHLRNSLYLGLGSDVFSELHDVFENCKQPGWDGDSAEPVVHDTYLNAFRFLESLPLGVQTPSVGVEPDGHITLEWYKAPRHTLSVSVSPDGFLYFSALMGLRKTNGSEPFFGDVPKIILELVGKIYAE